MRGRTRQGFTLIELLVVVGIIALLIAVLIPSLAAAREKAKLTVCQTHLRGWAQGFQYYTQSYDGCLPLDGGNGTSSNPIGKWSDPFLWFNGVVAMTNGDARTYDSLQLAKIAGTGVLPKGGADSLFVCPSAFDAASAVSGDTVTSGFFQTVGWKSTAPASLQTRDVLLCYAMNSQIRNWSWPANIAFYPGVPSAGDVSKMGALEPWPTMVVFAEKRIRQDELPTTDANYDKALAQNKVAPTRFAARHKKGGNLAFADAHVEWFSNAAVNAADNATPQYNQPGTMIWNPTQ
jgi:prepilin-type N-terminal cleavage/methylation domain-containing protein/prepilin-type processing-associated H-X9-DG protein